jgi:hypothetical protein
MAMTQCWGSYNPKGGRQFPVLSVLSFSFLKAILSYSCKIIFLPNILFPTCPSRHQQQIKFKSFWLLRPLNVASIPLIHHYYVPFLYPPTYPLFLLSILMLILHLWLNWHFVLWTIFCFSQLHQLHVICLETTRALHSAWCFPHQRSLHIGKTKFK